MFRTLSNRQLTSKLWSGVCLTTTTGRDQLVLVLATTVPATSRSSKSTPTPLFPTQIRLLNSSSTSSTRTTSSTPISASNVISPTTASAAASATDSTTKSKSGFRLPSNIKFNYCGGAVAKTKSGLPDGELTITGTQRPLVMVFGWMLAKNIHIEKYRQFWYDRGFDVMAVFTSPFDLLLPKIGGTRNALTLCQILTSEIQPRYNDIMIHTFSVGAYQFCEMLTKLLQNNDEKSEKVIRSLRGFIQDSTVYHDGCPPGLSRAITTHPIGQPTIEHTLEWYLRLTKPFTMDHYNAKYKIFLANERKLPSLFLYSKDDAAADYQKNHATFKNWQEKGILVREKCWDRSAHVLHFRGHPEEYRKEVDQFVTTLNIDNSNIKINLDN